MIALLGALCVLLALNLMGGAQAPAEGAEPVTGAPTAVGMSAFQDVTNNGAGTTQYRVFTQWSDGRVTWTYMTWPTCSELTVNCTGDLPSSCPADITADGAVDVLDLIPLLLAFGTACP